MLMESLPSNALHNVTPARGCSAPPRLFWSPRVIRPDPRSFREGGTWGGSIRRRRSQVAKTKQLCPLTTSCIYPWDYSLMFYLTAQMSLTLSGKFTTEVVRLLISLQRSNGQPTGKSRQWRTLNSKIFLKRSTDAMRRFTQSPIMNCLLELCVGEKRRSNARFYEEFKILSKTASL